MTKNEPWYVNQLELVEYFINRANKAWAEEHELPFQYTMREKIILANNIQYQFVEEGMPNFDQAELPMSLNREEGEWVEMEWKMYRKLSLFLCYYFLGASKPSLSVAVANLGANSQFGYAFPGGAFYLKLAGDIFRAERLKCEKEDAKNKSLDNPIKRDKITWEQKGILVMAYTPLLLLGPDLPQNEALKKYDKYEELERQHYLYIWKLKLATERLAARYARLQIHRYIKAGYPIRYAVSYFSVCDVLKNIPQNEHLGRMANEFEHYFPNSNSTTLPEDQEFMAMKNLVGKGLTSCVLGTKEGVSANRPNRPDARKALSYWVDSKLLDTDRRKLLDLWDSLSHAKKPPVNLWEAVKSGTLCTDHSVSPSQTENSSGSGVASISLDV